MPTIRPTKRLLMPVDPREKTLVENIIADQSAIWGVSNSDAIIRDIVDSHLPHGEFARWCAEGIFADGQTLMASISSVLDWNVSTGLESVAQPEYLPILEFGRKIIHRKFIYRLLSTEHEYAHHLRQRLSYVVDRMRNAEDPSSFFDPDHSRADYAQALLAGMDPGRTKEGPGGALVDLAIKDFAMIGAWPDTCSYLSDVFAIYDETLYGPDSPYDNVPDDTAELRAEWLHVLAQTTATWPAP